MHPQRDFMSRIFDELKLDRNKTLPHEGAYPVTIPAFGTQVEVWIANKDLAKRDGITQRTRAECPHCHKEFAAGNLRQHLFGYRRWIKGETRFAQGCINRQSKPTG